LQKVRAISEKQIAKGHFPTTNCRIPSMKSFLAIFATASALALQAQQFTVYVGTYTAPGASRGIYKFNFDATTGAAGAPELAAESQSPSFLAIHPNGRFLYAVNEMDAFGGKKQGAVSAYSINPKTRALASLNQQPSIGDGPCHINVDRQGKNILIANYGGGSVAVLPIDAAGELKPASSFIQHTGSSANKSRQSEPHAHSINLDQSGKYAFVCDLGLDKIFTYAFDPVAGKLTEKTFTPVKPGSGPRHFTFTPDFKRAFAINEISQTITAFNYDGNGKLTEFQTITTVPEETRGNSTAEIAIHPSGKYLYGSNRGHNSIAVFTVEPGSGQLCLVQNESTQGKTPRNFVIDPTGKYLLAANQDSDNIAIFSIDQATGKLSSTGKSIQAFKPVCLRFLKQ
jgi:6-phosphogluconolactonase